MDWLNPIELTSLGSFQLKSIIHKTLEASFSVTAAGLRNEISPDTTRAYPADILESLKNRYAFFQALG